MPQIWGENHCEHEWGIGLSQRQRGATKGVTAQVGNQINEVCGTSIGQGNFCLKCHAWRGELGLEPTIELYVSHLIQIFDEVKRVLKKTGTCFVNLDDSYASGKGTCFNPGGGAKSLEGHSKLKDAEAYPLNRGNKSTLEEQGLLPKSLCLIPSRFALAMVEHGWILRNDIVWYKSNPMPESVKDRFTGTWEHLFFFVKSQRYFFEQQFEPQQEDSLLRVMRGWDGSTDRDYPNGPQSHINKYFNKTKEEIDELRIRGRNKRDVWQINTEPTAQWHGIKNYATFPEKLCETPILSGCPSQICKKCGKARGRIYESSNDKRTRKVGEGQDTEIGTQGRAGEPEVIDKGYTDCGCNAGWTSGVVLDPFCGSGKALSVAKRLGRKCIGIDLNPDYCKLAVKELQKISMPMELV